MPLVIVENGVRLRLNIVDTPGYGDNVNNENWYVRALPHRLPFLFLGPSTAIAPS